MDKFQVRDLRQTNWFRDQNEVFRITTGPSALSAKAKLVRLCLASFCNEASGEAWPSIPRIAAECSLSESSVRRALTELEEKGWIIKESRFQDGRQTSNIYGLLNAPSQLGKEGVTVTGGGCHGDRAEHALSNNPKGSSSSNSSPSSSLVRAALSSGTIDDDDDENEAVKYWTENGGEELTLLQRRQVRVWSRMKGRDFVLSAMQNTLLAGSCRFAYLRKAVESPFWQRNGAYEGAPNAAAYSTNDGMDEKRRRWLEMYPDAYDSKEHSALVEAEAILRR